MRARLDVLGMDVDFEAGEAMRTEISCKFTREWLTREYTAAGLDVAGWYTDGDGLFALSLTAPAGAAG
jgi:L-histidine N-alpha-methyltransferase